ncbi:hypothetical protein C8R44DRAFT_868523 [Mycena epipterygia]|nr:hypothetical protein C8R44DRAFT_868523 [Mycena epipterygia]
MLWSHFLLLSLCLHSVFAKLVTTIIDDAFPGDTQSNISYAPSLALWVNGSATNHGRVMPDPSQALDGTWHDTTDDTTPGHNGTAARFMELNFHGTGIDVRCIIPNNLNDPSIPPFTGTNSNYSFFIDSVPQSRDFVHEAGTTGDAFNYNVSVFSTSGLSNGPHSLWLLLHGGPEATGSTVLLLFDYAIITSDDGTGATSPPAKASTATGASVKSSSPATSTSSGSSTPTHSNSSAPVQSSAAHKFNIGAIVGGLSAPIVTPTYFHSPMPTFLILHRIPSCVIYLKENGKSGACPTVFITPAETQSQPTSSIDSVTLGG